MLSSNHSISPASDEQRGNVSQNPFDTNELLTVKEFAALLRVPVSWVYDRTRKRSIDRLPGIRLGKYWRFRQTEVLAWGESQRVRSNAP